MTPGPGHNGGPPLAGLGWQRHCWTKARADLLPHLPIEVVRLRVRRAAELGLDYRSYASVRAATGHDLVALLFSSNALRVFAPLPTLPADRAAKLGTLRDALRLGLACGQLSPEALQRVAALDGAHPAPRALGVWAAQRQAIRDALAGRKLPGDRVLLIGDHGLERDWCAAGGLAGYIPADRYFAAPAS